MINSAKPIVGVAVGVAADGFRYRSTHPTDHPTESGWVWQRGLNLWGLWSRVGLVPALEPLGNRMQSGVVAALRLDFRNRGQNVIQIRPGSAMSLPYQMGLMLKTKASGILGMAAVDQEHEGHHVARRRRCKRNAARGFNVNGGYLFAFPQIRDGGTTIRRCHPIGDAAAGAAAVEAEHEAGLFRGTAVNVRIHTQRPVQPDEPRRDAFKIRETRPPHERTVAENPKIFIGGRVRKVHERRLWFGREASLTAGEGRRKIHRKIRDGNEEIA